LEKLGVNILENKKVNISLLQLYEKLLSTYGLQGWWPVLIKTTNKTTISYHPQNYNIPENRLQQFEIAVGAILTQNTTWKNAKLAIFNLHNKHLLSAEQIQQIEEKNLAQIIKPSGYFNMKARKLKNLAQLFLQLNEQPPSRKQLLNVWGIGEETADSILLYAFKQCEMVVDTYSKRILQHLGFIDPNLKYKELKNFCCQNLPKDLKIYQEFHALIVKHAKNYYLKKPYYDNLFTI